MQIKENPSYTSLFLSFFWIGLTAFGGPAMTVHIRNQIVNKKKWLDENTFDSGLALCQIIPGAIVMQLAAFIGLKVRGIKGAVICFIGFGLPAFLIMFILSVIYKHSKNIESVESVLNGLRIIIIAIVANAAFIFGKKNIRNINDLGITIIASILFFFSVHPALVLLIAALTGLKFTNKDFDLPKKKGMTKTFSFVLWIITIIAISTGILYFINIEYFTLATIMFRIDVFSFGGGLAAMPIMYHELVDLYGWFDSHTFMDGIILGQVTPGSIIIAAAFFGYLHFGIFGSIIATIAVFTPSFLILTALIPFFDKLKLYPFFNKIINGILCSFAGLLAVVTYRFTIGIHWDIINILITLIAFILLLKKVDVIWIIIGGVLLTFII